MEKSICTTKTVYSFQHEFYCDECNKYIGSSNEYDDGYYEKIGEYKLNFFSKGWFSLHKTLCPECAKKYTQKIQNTLFELGFVADFL